MTTYDDAFNNSLKYFNGDELAAQVFLGKYALSTVDGNIKEKTPDDMHRRLAKEFARIEKKYPNPLSYEEIFELLSGFRYIVPQGSPMSGIGNKDKIQSISNCFTLEPPYDSYSGILKTDQELVQIAKRRGGIGFDISKIRPKGLNTQNAAGTTDGIGVFMERFSNSTREVAQSGRRGALMLTISVHHPEIETFINIKKDKKKVTGANISIRLTDEFMKAVEANEKFELRWPVKSNNPQISKMVNAKEIWEKIIEAAWASAEPGLLFWDNVITNTPSDYYTHKGFESVGVNPCSELVLSSDDACRLLLVNLYSFVNDPYTSKASCDWEKFKSVVQKAQRLMDDIVDIEIECIDRILDKIDSDPEPEEVKIYEKNLWKRIKTKTEQGRRTGTGITGLGDMIAALGMVYGDENSIEFTEKLFKQFAITTTEATIDLAAERGSFPIWESGELQHPFLGKVYHELTSEYQEKWKQYGRRNIALTTIAPAGSVSMLTQTTSGIEPAFLVSYKRRKKINPNDQNSRVDFVDDLGDKWQEYKVYHHGFKKWMEVNNKTEDDIKKSPYWKATSNDIDWRSSVKLQAAAQKWIEHSISKTCNLPKETSKEVVADVYMLAWKYGCKGFTIYRDGCRSGVLVTEDASNTNKKNDFVENHAPKRPEKLPCDIYHMQVRGEKWNFFVGLYKDRPYEIFAGRSKHIHLPKNRKQGFIKKNGVYNLYTGEGENELVIEDLATVFENPTESAFTRTVSLALRHGAPVQYIVEQIEKGADKENEMFTLAKGLMRVLKNYIKNGTKASVKKCTECGGTELAYQEGCLTCKNCGHSKCG